MSTLPGTSPTAQASVPEIPVELRERMLEVYQHLHSHPELSMQEHRTAEFIEAQLRSSRPRPSSGPAPWC